MTLLVSEKVAKGLELIKNGFYNINTLEKAINNQGMEVHIDVKPVFEELTKEDILNALFYGYEIEENKVKLEDLDKAFRIERLNGDVYHVVIYNDLAYVAHNETSTSAPYSIDSVLNYINEGTWVII